MITDCVLHQVGPIPSLWRAPTDNDEFGRYADQWRAAGLHNMSRALEGLRAWQPCRSLVSVLVDWRLLGDKGQRLGTATFVYLIAGDASIEICCHLQLQVRRWPLMTADDG
jgi:hypothetical protein